MKTERDKSMAITINQINQAIMFGDLTNDQLNSIIAALKFARNEMNKTKKWAFDPGCKVKFVYKGTLYIGVVQKILTKNVAVKVQAGNVYRVPAAWLEAAA
jgi:hypothetical protein